MIGTGLNIRIEAVAMDIQFGVELFFCFSMSELIAFSG
jgi:hypothetical protein